MEKILLALNATSRAPSALECGCYFASLTNSRLTGVFLEDLESEEKAVMKRKFGLVYVDWIVDEESSEHQVKMASIKSTIEWFKEGCKAHGIRFNIHNDKNVPDAELLTESRFADLVVMDGATSFKRFYEGEPSSFAKDFMRNAECPVLIAPAVFNTIDEIIFAYDGTASSVFAMKQFTYLFPQLRNKKAIILQNNKTGTWEDRDKYNFTEWLHEHYSSLQFVAEKTPRKGGLFQTLLPKENSILVLGAYSRNPVSLFFKESAANQVIQTMNMPVFVAHH